MLGELDFVIYGPEISQFMEETEHCRKLLGSANETRYKTENGESVVCFRGRNADDITIIVSHPQKLPPQQVRKVSPAQEERPACSQKGC